MKACTFPEEKLAGCTRPQTKPSEASLLASGMSRGRRPARQFSRQAPMYCESPVCARTFQSAPELLAFSSYCGVLWQKRQQCPPLRVEARIRPAACRNVRKTDCGLALLMSLSGHECCRRMIEPNTTPTPTSKAHRIYSSTVDLDSTISNTFTRATLSGVVSAGNI